MVRYTHLRDDALNVDGGSTPWPERRSAATKAISSSTAARTIAAVTARLDRIPATLTSKAAAVSNASERTGTGLLVVLPGSCAGSALGTRAATAIVAMTRTPKAHRQAPN